MKLTLNNIKTEDNLELPALLFEPKVKSKKAVIYLHGMMGNAFYSVDKFNVYAQKLTSKGIAFLALNNRGAGYIHYLKKKISETETIRVKAGSAYEIIKESTFDIDASIKFLEESGYEEFYLVGHSTGANKICVYDFYKPNNKISKYILLAGGDDTGQEFSNRGEKNFFEALEKSKNQVLKGNGENLSPKYLSNPQFSYQSLYDIMNPEGDYNSFPFYEVLFNKRISKKDHFREFKKINKPTLVVYGDNDEFCYGRVLDCINAMKEGVRMKNNFEFKIIENTDHSFSLKENEVADLISSWLNSND